MCTTIYGAFHNPCVYESADELLSLHTTEGAAREAMFKRQREEIRFWKKTRSGAVPDYMTFTVKELTVHGKPQED